MFGYGGGCHIWHLGEASGRLPVGFHTGRHCLNFTGLVSVAQQSQSRLTRPHDRGSLGLLGQVVWETSAPHLGTQRPTGTAPGTCLPGSRSLGWHRGAYSTCPPAKYTVSISIVKYHSNYCINKYIYISNNKL